MITVKNLHYEYDENILIDSLSFSLNTGDFLYISGENGKGKTTLLKLIAGIFSPTWGEIFWENQPIHKNHEYFHQHVNYIGHKSAIALSLTPKENLYFFSQAYSVKNSISEALIMAGLKHYADTPASFLSAGQIRRIALAKLLLLDTPLWLLDEPYTALDAQSVSWLQRNIHAHLEQNGIVIMTSHQACGIKASHRMEIIL